ncbi:MAG: ATP-binding protein [Chloroflexi bacterium]|nr:ATP-binding protein [Chloroflexota bacterium]
MLIRFMVENFLSFKDEVEFSMVAGRSRKHPDHIVKVADLRLLKTGVILGANASGKTNLIKAMSFAQDFITTGSLRTEHLGLTPFLLDSSSAEEPSKFLFEFQCGIGQSFEYQFVVDAKRVHRESLYEILPASTRMIFERKTNPDGHTNVEIDPVSVVVSNGEEPFDFIPKTGDRKQLFLTQYTRLEDRIGEPRIAFLSMIYDWFNSTLAPIFTDSVLATGIPIGLMKPGELQSRYLEILGKLDLGIDDIGLKEIHEFVADRDLSDDFKEYAEQFTMQLQPNTDQAAVFYNVHRDSYVFADANARFSEYEVITYHTVKDSNTKRPFDLRLESDGTRRLLKLIPALFGLLNEKADYVFVLDELDRSLHTQLSYKLMELFLENSGNRRSQLIVTTHDTSLLDLDLLRSDEIWFLEKDGHGVSSLFSLEEFKLSQNMNIQKGYLGGRLGAIPILTNDDALEWAE